MQSPSTPLIRVRLDLAYDGTAFHGWAYQPGLRTVEGELSRALETVLRENISLTVGGRTDAGVHARGNVAHFDVSAESFEAVRGRSGESAEECLRRRLMGVLAYNMRAHSAHSEESSGDGKRSVEPKGSSDIVVKDVCRVPSEFDARFSALGRIYTYRMCDRPTLFDPLRRRDVLWVDKTLDIHAMNAAAETLLGEHDFLSFCKPREGATTIRELQKLCVLRGQDGLIEIHAQADAFCHSMVRTLVGTLMRVGSGERPIQWALQRLEERSRDGEVVVAPPHPLTLERIIYPDSPDEYAERARHTRAVRSS